jgi:beta-lactamase regulating signal transducer with metallopeptidase domain
MATHFFTQSWLLQAVGWGIINSFWQSATLWIVYKAITSTNKNCPALFKHHLSLLCLISSLIWFVLTIATHYLSLKNLHTFPASFIVISSYQIPADLNFLLPIFSTVYFCLLCFYTLQFCKQYFSLFPQRNKSLIKTPVEIRLFTQQAALHIGIKKNVAVWLSKNIDVPSVSGFFKPVILIPFALLNQLSTAQVEAILLHEMAHIKRDDYLINLLQLIAENLLFFNPFALLLSSSLKQEREKCCDDWVINYQYNQKDYAAALVLVEQNRSRQLTLALAATNGKKNLLDRVQRIFSVTPVTHFNFNQQFKLATATVVIIAWVLFLQPTLEQPSTNKLALKTKSIINKPAFSFKNENGIKAKGPKLFSRLVNKTKLKRLISNLKDTSETIPIAFVNETLLQNNVEIDNAATNVVNNETLAAQLLFVKVEEENSGTKGKKIYYLQMNNDNGKTAIKPLAFINKQQPVKPIKLAGKKNISKKKVAA